MFLGASYILTKVLCVNITTQTRSCFRTARFRTKALKINMWDERYSDADFVYGTEPNDFLKHCVTNNLIDVQTPVATTSCLLIGDGEGRNGVYMAEQGFQVTSMDASVVGMQKAEVLAKSKSLPLTTVVADLADFDFGDSSWDHIISIFCHLPPDLKEKVLGAVPKALKPGGYFVLEGYTPDQLEYKTGGPGDVNMLFTADMLEEKLGSQLQIVRNQELVRDVVEGKYHSGKAAVVQFIAKKP